MSLRLNCVLRVDDGMPVLEVNDFIGKDPETGMGTSATDVKRELRKYKGVPELKVLINSGGGLFYEGLTIYRMLRSLGARITTEVQAVAASAGSIVMMAGDVIRVPAESMVMIHEARGGIVEASASEIRAMAEQLDGINRSAAQIYSERTGRPIEEIAAMMAAETWMVGQEIIDNKFGTELVERPIVMANVNLSNFQNVPEMARRLIDQQGVDSMPENEERNEDVVEQTAETTPAVESVSEQPETPAIEVAGEVGEAQPAETELVAEPAMSIEKQVQMAIQKDRKRTNAIIAACKMASVGEPQMRQYIDSGKDLADITMALSAKMCVDNPGVGDEAPAEADPDAKYKQEYREAKRLRPNMCSTEEQYVKSRKKSDGLI